MYCCSLGWHDWQTYCYDPLGDVVTECRGCGKLDFNKCDIAPIMPAGTQCAIDRSSSRKWGTTFIIHINRLCPPRVRHLIEQAHAGTPPEVPLWERM